MQYNKEVLIPLDHCGSMQFLTIETTDPLKDKELLLSSGSEISFFDLDRIICEKQLFAAIDRVERLGDRYISNSFGIELLIELAGYPQISKAITILEITENTKKIAVISKSKFTYEGSGKLIEGIHVSGDKEDSLADLYSLTPGNLCNKVIARAATMRS